MPSVMDRKDRVRASVRLIRASAILMSSSLLPGSLAMLIQHWCRVSSIVAMFISIAAWLGIMGCACSLGGILLSVCPRCGKSNKDALYSFGRILPIMEIVIFGKLPLCYACERELAAKASAKKDGKPVTVVSALAGTAGERRATCDVDALTRSDCFSIEIPRRLKVALILMAIAIPNIALLALAVLHVTGVKPLW